MAKGWTPSGRYAPCFILVVAAALLAAGCEHDQYTLELSVQGNVLHRTLTVERIGGKEGGNPTVNVEALNAICKVYGRKPFHAPAQKEPFTGTFTGRTPDDIGGSGSVLHYATPLGSLTAYIETFRGNDDTLEQTEARTRVVDNIVRILRGWLRRELGQKDGFEKLDAFLDNDFRRDLKSLALYSWLMENRDKQLHPGLPEPAPEGGQAEAAPTQPDETADAKTPQPDEPTPADAVTARVIQFLLKRNYVPAELLPKAAALFENLDQKQSEFSQLLRHVLVHKAGLRDHKELVDSVTDFFARAFGDSDAMEESLKKHIYETEEFHAFEKQYQPPADAKPADEEDPKDKIFDAYVKSLGVDALLNWTGGTSDGLIVKLSLPPQAVPIKSNGKGDPKTNQLQWHGSIPAREEHYYNLPALCYAAWATPDATAQTRQFGKVVLTGPDLAEYVAWQRGLPEARETQWTAFSRTLSAGTIDRLLTFQFPGDEAPAIRNHHVLHTLYIRVSGKEVPPAPKAADGTPNPVPAGK